MKLSQLSLADYNQLDSIPVINQDLSASGFTPVANTYYRHTGTTTSTFTQGVIYLYDTAYHKLGESGGGTTLNQYTYDLSCSKSSIDASRIVRIIQQAKGTVGISMSGSDPGTSLSYSFNINSYLVFTGVSINYNSNTLTYVTIFVDAYGQVWTPGAVVSNYSKMITIDESDTRTVTKTNIVGKSAILRVTYFNDTEIT